MINIPCGAVHFELFVRLGSDEAFNLFHVLHLDKVKDLFADTEE